jgi:hypothetical protein
MCWCRFGSRAFYAKWHDIYFEFQDKKFRDWFVEHSDAEVVRAQEVYDSGKYLDTVNLSHWMYRKSRAYNDNKQHSVRS